MTRILILQGHPDASQPHFNHALADAYGRGAEDHGHDVRRIDVAKLDFPLLRDPEQWMHGAVPPGLVEAQHAIGWAQHLVIFFPLWLGGVPALLKGFLEQVARPGFAFHPEGKNPLANKGLTGRSARVVVTMGMPALIYRFYFRAHSLRALERNILGFVGIAPIHETLIGRLGELSDRQRADWLKKLEKLGQQAG
ncbi:NAD(P)H-dependent oxidoreductase [uncultured Azohydromonas sp.]|jgi:Putative NADPH-quinone reductase (modulator of drug activity B)|uniref:NAD(P)H-dependent oxidoreductase n=1 Tax=uncultured Azohydromonas sp. TaxID=487342 RepID=UPI00261EBFCC|nr:NAD(P)H-dependent oxidoreductase [uncultured Azohydromonas sp.]